MFKKYRRFTNGIFFQLSLKPGKFHITLTHKETEIK